VHELSIAQALVSAALQHADDGAVEAAVGRPVVREVHVRIGALSGVVPHALDFAYDVAVHGTPLAGSRLVITFVPAVVHCAGCGADATLDGPIALLCPACGALTGDVRAGYELELSHLVVDDEAATEPAGWATPAGERMVT
jgi:hydrogenase nickel incorporation protein HypA/HybF